MLADCWLYYLVVGMHELQGNFVIKTYIDKSKQEVSGDGCLFFKVLPNNLQQFIGVLVEAVQMLFWLLNSWIECISSSDLFETYYDSDTNH